MVQKWQQLEICYMEPISLPKSEKKHFRSFLTKTPEADVKRKNGRKWFTVATMKNDSSNNIAADMLVTLSEVQWK